MSGIDNLIELLRYINPVLSNEDYVFCFIPNSGLVPSYISSWATIQENEGITLILTGEQAADLDIQKSSCFKRITLTVHSSLVAVGLTAKVSSVLDQNDISANVVAGFYHDHIFVPSARAEEALLLLRRLQTEQV